MVRIPRSYSSGFYNIWTRIDCLFAALNIYHSAEQSAQKKLTTKWAKQRKAQSKNVKSSSRKNSYEGFTNIRSGRGSESALEKSVKRPVRRAAEDSVGTWADNNSSDSSTGANRKTAKRIVKKSGPNYVGRNARLRVGLNRNNEETRSYALGEEDLPSAEGNSSASLLENTPVERHLEENEQLIIDLLSRSQPFMDHNYTTIFGKRAMHENYCPDLDLSDLDEEDNAARSSGKRIKTIKDLTGAGNDPTGKTLTLKVNAGTVPNVNNVHIPIIRLARIPVAPDGTPLVSAEEVVVQENDAVEEIMRKHNMGSTNAMRKFHFF